MSSFRSAHSGNSSFQSNGNGRVPDECALYVRFPVNGIREQFGGVRQVISKENADYAFVIFEKPEYALYAAKIFHQVPFLGGKLVATPRDRTENNGKFKNWERENRYEYTFDHGTKYSDLRELDFASMNTFAAFPVFESGDEGGIIVLDDSEVTNAAVSEVSPLEVSARQETYIETDVVVFDGTTDSNLEQSADSDIEIIEDVKPETPEDGELRSGDESDDGPVSKKRRW